MPSLRTINSRCVTVSFSRLTDQDGATGLINDDVFPDTALAVAKAILIERDDKKRLQQLHCDLTAQAPQSSKLLLT